MTGPIRTILAAVDFSPSSERALDYTLAVAKRAGPGDWSNDLA